VKILIIRLSCFLALAVFLATTPLTGQIPDKWSTTKPQRSSDGLFEVYQISRTTEKDVTGAPYGFGTNLYLRATGSRSPGIVIRSNDRWMDQQWCPGTGLLAVQDCWDTHECDVYVYEVRLSPDRQSILYRLVFRSPWNTVDHLWAIDGWDAKHRVIRLSIEQWADHSLLGHEHWQPATGRYAFLIGTSSLDDSDKLE
jgi:hypothetical protein